MIDEIIMMIDKQIKTTAFFNVDDIREAAKCSNFNKGLGQDCLDGGALKTSNKICEKVLIEIMQALNDGSIPEYLNAGRLVPLQKT